MTTVLHDVTNWPAFKPLIIAHDVGRSRDRSTAVVGATAPPATSLGIAEAEELPQGLVGKRTCQCIGRRRPALS